MENAAGQLGFAFAAIAFAVGAICFLLLGLKELNAAVREYSESLDREEGYQKLARVKNSNLQAIGLFFKSAALFLAGGLALDVFNEEIFWAYFGAFLAAFFAVWRYSERRYITHLKKELGIK